MARNITTTRRLRRLGDWTTKFVRDWHEAAEAGLNMTEFAELIGLNYTTVAMRKHALKVRGVALPPLRRQKHTTRRAAAKRAATPAAVVHKAPAMFIPFTITVGG
jgi:hypothetical protein